MNMHFGLVIAGFFIVCSPAMGQEIQTPEQMIGVWEGEYRFGDQLMARKLEFYKDENGRLSVRYYRDKDDNNSENEEISSPFKDVQFNYPSITWKVELFRKNKSSKRPNRPQPFGTIRATIEDNTIYGPLLMPKNFSPREAGSINMTKQMSSSENQ